MPSRPIIGAWLFALMPACGTPPATSEAPSVQEITAELVTVRVDPSARPPLVAAASDIKGREDDYGYELDQEPLPSGAVMSNECIYMVVRSDSGPARCEPWSTCEVQSVFEVNKDVFQLCLRKAGPAAAGAGIAFTLRARIRKDGVVEQAELTQLLPADDGVRGCILNSVRQLPFALESSELTTILTVPVHVVAQSASTP